MNNTKSFVENLNHDELVRLNASLRFFLGYDTSKREAYTHSLLIFPDIKEELQENIKMVFDMSGFDFFNNVTNSDWIRS